MIRLSPHYINLVLQEFACNGTVVEHAEWGEVIQLQGDQRSSIKDFLMRMKLADENQLKVIVYLMMASHYGW